MPLQRKMTQAERTAALFDGLTKSLVEEHDARVNWGVSLTDKLVVLLNVMLKQTQQLLPKDNTLWGRLRWLLTGR